MATTKEALKLLRTFPRINLNNIRPRMPPTKRQSLKRQRGLGARGQGRHGTLPRIGFEGGQTPFYLKIPKESYYKGHSLRKEYVPVSLLQLQRMIDLGRLDTDRPIDLAAICNSQLVKVDTDLRHYGIHLTDEGADLFNAEICLEVQWVDEMAVAALERSGSYVTTRYYDPRAIRVLTDPEKFFLTGKPIPTCKTPTSDVLEYYCSARARGYLADIDDVKKDRTELAQKYGYQLPSLSQQVQELASEKKTALQIFYGLQPGWIVNLADEEIIKPTDGKLLNLYNTESMF